MRSPYHDTRRSSPPALYAALYASAYASRALFSSCLLRAVARQRVRLIMISLLMFTRERYTQELSREAVMSHIRE